jgi:hypothetical protein
MGGGVRGDEGNARDGIDCEDEGGESKGGGATVVRVKMVKIMP